MSVLLAYVHAPLTPRHPDHRQHHRSTTLPAQGRLAPPPAGRAYRHRFSNSSAAFTDFTPQLGNWRLAFAVLHMNWRAGWPPLNRLGTTRDSRGMRVVARARATFDT